MTDSRSSGLSRLEITRLVNRYIGVHGGYLGDFSYNSHADFYPEYCDLDINPYAFEGTTRERFIQIISSRAPADQAKIIRGILEKYPVGSDDRRTPELAAALGSLAKRLEQDRVVKAVPLTATSAVVRRAIDDVDALLRAGGPTSCVDRVHTFLHGHLRYLCESAGIGFAEEDGTTALLKKLRREHPLMEEMGARGGDIAKILNNCGSILDALTPVRNRASVAHPNTDLLARPEALLVVNTGRTLLAYLDDRLGTRHEDVQGDGQ